MRYIFTILISLSFLTMQAQRARDYGIKIGVLATGQQNAITDVSGVLVGQQTLYEKTLKIMKRYKKI